MLLVRYCQKKVQEVKECLRYNNLSQHHKFVMQQVSDHIKYLNAECENLTKQIFAAMEPYQLLTS